MHRPALLSALIICGFSLNATAAEFTANARVVEVSPIYEQVNRPTSICDRQYFRDEEVSSNNSPAGAIVGGIAGGLLGSTIGRGNGRVAAAAVGAGVGAIVGDRLSDSRARNEFRSDSRSTCRQVDSWSQEEVGYRVFYEFNGEVLSYATTSRPRSGYIPVRVSVSPL